MAFGAYNPLLFQIVCVKPPVFRFMGQVLWETGDEQSERRLENDQQRKTDEEDGDNDTQKACYISE